MQDSRKTREELEIEVVALQRKVAHYEAALASAEDRLRQNIPSDHQIADDTFRIALDAANMVAWDLDVATDKVRHSSETPREVEIAGTKITTGAQIINLTHPEDRERVQEALRRSVFTGESYNVEFRIIDSANRIRWMTGHGKVLVDANRNPTHITGVVMDITARKEQELELCERQRWIERISALTPGVVYLTNVVEQRSILLSPPNVDILGYTNTEIQELAGIEGHRLIHPEDRARFAEYIEKLESAADGQEIGIEYRVKHKDGTWHWALSRNSVFSRTTDGKVLQVLGVAVDISDRKRTEEALQQLSRQLLKIQEKERRYLARELHEEVGQSLTALLMKMQILEAELSQSRSHPTLQDGIALVQTMISQVRNLSLDLRPTMLDNLGLSAALQWYVQQQSQRTGIAMDLFADSGVVRPDRVVEEACFRVVQEAVTNAIRHANAQNIWVELRATNDIVEISVRDDGAGFHLDEILRKPKEERGIGLWGMEERLRQIGGCLVVQSTLGEGTDVHITAPVRGQPV